MVYATAEEVSADRGILVSDLPANIDTMLEDASDFMDYLVGNNAFDLTVAEDVALAKHCVACQIEFWIQVGESVDVTGPLQGYQIGSVQIQYGAGDNRVAATTVAPRAYRALLRAGKLYRGVGIQ